MTASAHSRRAERRAELLALGFGISTAMWGLAYLSRLASPLVPPWLLFALLLLTPAAGGWLGARASGRGLELGMAAGAVASLLNLLILGSVIGGDVPGALRRGALLWVPASVLLGILLAGAGAWLGARGSGTRPRFATGLGADAAFAGIAAAATLLLLAAGGLVTSKEAGLAVVDWPNSYGFNMFLYPLARMTGGVFYEHAHRLLGSLVGLCSLVLALHLQFSRQRAAIKVLAWLIVAAVLVQGILGGLRVTGRFTMSQSTLDMSPSTVLAVLHAVLGQLCFALLLSLQAGASRLWNSDRAPASRPSGLSDRQLGPLLLAALVLQLILGALLRHFAWGMVWHVSFAMVVALLGVAVGARHWGLYGDLPWLRPLGRALTLLIGLQLLLGTGALIAVSASPAPGDIPWWEALLATVHQLTGALILGSALLIALWDRRLLAPAAPEGVSP
jgi:cytochrome c oxidase assembly protein subunit 15